MRTSFARQFAVNVHAAWVTRERKIKPAPSFARIFIVIALTVIFIFSGMPAGCEYLLHGTTGEQHGH